METGKKISDLTSNPAINGSEEIAEERGGSNYKNTLEDIKTWVLEGVETDGVQTVTGEGVNDTDPKNPVLSFPDTSEVTETTDKKYVTDAEKVVISNTSGTNTGDQDLSDLQPILSEGAFVDGDKTKLDNQSNTNTGDETTVTIQAKRPIKTINGDSLEGTGNVVVGSGTVVVEGTIEDTNTLNAVSGRAVNRNLKTPTEESLVDVYTLSANTSTNWVIESAKLFIDNGESLAIGINLYSASAGDINVNYIKKDGLDAVIVKTQIFSASIGLNSFEIDYDGVDSETETWIGIKPSSNNVLQYTTTSQYTVPAFNFTSTGQPYSVTTTLGFGYWLTYLSPKYLETIPDSQSIPTGTKFDLDLASAILDYESIKLPPGDVIITETLNIPGGKTISGSKGLSRIICQGAGVHLQISDPGLVSLSNFTIVGNGAAIDTSDVTVTTDTEIKDFQGMGTEVGIMINSNATLADIDIRNIHVQNIDGIGIHSAVLTRNRRGVFTDLSFTDCYIGLKIDTEYTNVTNIVSNNCIYGAVIVGGNNYFSNCNFSYNRIGFYISDGVNDSHGSISNSSINHSSLYGPVMIDTINGYIFNGCQTYDSKMRISGAVGFAFNSGIVGGQVHINDSVVMLSDNFAPSTGGAFLIVETGTNTLIKNHNYRQDGTLIV